MGLDTKYRPKSYSEVLGQESTIQIFREVVKKGYGFRQSYCLSGPFGTGKTTLARIFAKSLLCDSPVDGEGCNSCPSCTLVNEGKSHPNIIEIDAASNSRKEDMERILEEVSHSSFTGKRRVYIMDEAHELSKASQDTLLLPLEGTLPGSLDKRMVCIFCTTEVHKMRPAILSRCAPGFVVSLVSVESISNRLETVCLSEGIEFEKEALTILAEVNECHIRDCLKALDSISSFGEVTKNRVLEFSNHNHNEKIVDLLISLFDPEFSSSIPSLVEDLTLKISPSFLYRKLSEYAMLAFKTKDNSPFPSFLNEGKMRTLHSKGSHLLSLVRVFSSKPWNADTFVLICDLQLCHEKIHGLNISPIRVSRKNKDAGNMESELTSMGVFVKKKNEGGDVSPKVHKPSLSEKLQGL